MAIPMQLIALLEKIEKVYGNTYTTLEEKAQDLQAHTNLSITCKKGCGACCHFPLIPVASAETYVLYSLITTASPDKESLKQHLRNYAIKYLNFAHKENSLPITEAQQRKAFLELSMPCPLFIPTGDHFEGHCGVFAHRPIICNSYHSLDSASLCAQKQAHSSFQDLISLGEEALTDIQNFERNLLGHTALGHLPLLLAAFTFEEFTQYYLQGGSTIEANHLDSETRDFNLFAEALSTLGYHFSQNDLNSWTQAQEEHNKPPESDA